MCLLAVAASSLAAPAADPQVVPYINQGAASGPLTAAVGDLVATPKGYRSLALEGFSEDLNQDGFVDPLAPAVPVVQYAAPQVLSYAAPVAVQAAPAETKVVAAPAVAAYHVAAPQAVSYAAPVAVKAGVVPASTAKVVAAPAVAYHAAPAVVATAPVVQHVGYNVHHTVQHVPQVSVAKHVTHHTTQHVINHAPVVGAYHGLLAAPAVAVAAPAVAEE